MRGKHVGPGLLVAMILCRVEIAAADSQAQTQAPAPEQARRLDPDDTPAAHESPWSRGVAPAQRQEARALYQTGNQELRDMRFARAAAAYEDALARWDHPGIHYNLAIAYIHLGRLVDAYESVRMALRHGGAALHASERAQARRYLRQLRGQIAELALVSAEPDAVVRLDGKPVLTGAGRVARRLAPDGYHLAVSKPGYRAETRDYVLAPGSRVTLAIARHRPLIGAEAARDLILGGLVLGATGAVLHAMARDQHAAFDERLRAWCPDGCHDQDPSSPAAMLRSARWTQRLAVGAYVAGGGLLSAGLTALLLGRDKRLDITARVTAVEVTLAPAGAVTGLAIAARF